MKTEQITTLTATFEAHAQRTESGVEYWLARDVQHLLGYSEWRNFGTVISKAKTACEVSGHRVADHFVDVNKMVQLGRRSIPARSGKCRRSENARSHVQKKDFSYHVVDNVYRKMPFYIHVKKL